MPAVPKYWGSIMVEDGSEKMEPPLPPVARVFEPLQDEGFPIITYNLADGVEGYRTLNARRIERALIIAPDVFLGVPITTLAPNPNSEGRRSHHIVRVITLEPEYAVDNLFRDENIYWTAFRRVRNGVEGTWYVCDNENMPGNIHAERLGLDSNHEGRSITTLGDMYALNASLMHMALFEDVRVPGRHPGKDMQRAKARVVVTLGEGLRFWCVNEETAERMENNVPSAILQPTLWHRMQSWQVIGDLMLDIRRAFGLPEDHPLILRIQERLAAIFANPQYEFANLEAII
ncbi:hypothetical protein EJB05_25538 [Eragrostis curvula]|uniref:Uncharacterized protein n=1 Tax=Eragrostis curvula TaxID=38414 RepID=A0A5J9VCM6_9POAL|nr:hypothetical protein EJB05_25538 [Eragrostis curvula]